MVTRPGTAVLDAKRLAYNPATTFVWTFKGTLARIPSKFDFVRLGGSLKLGDLIRSQGASSHLQKFDVSEGGWYLRRCERQRDQSEENDDPHGDARGEMFVSSIWCDVSYL